MLHSRRLRLLSLGNGLRACTFSLQGITPAITSELFGLQNFATNYAIIQMGPAMGALQTVK